jgi:cation:H+ antiporter
MDLVELPLSNNIFIFAICSLVVAIGGTRLTRVADRLADLTGWGEAMVGAIFLGGVTSLSGIVTSVTAAFENYPELSLSNAIGGIAAQSVFLAVADISYRKANLEHAAASLANIMQSVLLVAILCLFLIGHSLPAFTLFQIHPISILILILYWTGQKMIRRAEVTPMWRAVKTKETKADLPDPQTLKKSKLSTVILQFVLLGGMIGCAGFFLAKSAIGTSVNSGLSEGLVGALMTSVASSLPELIVSVAAVRQGALTLAVSSIIGGNTFDVLFVSFSDIAYRQGSILHSMGLSQQFIILLTILITTILTLGLLYRQKQGIGKIGWESLMIILVFITGYAVLVYLD